MKTFWRIAGAAGVIFWGAILLTLWPHFTKWQIVGCIGLLVCNVFTVWKYRWKRS